MYIALPLILICVSAILIVIIVARKIPYLRKLTPDAHEVEGNLFSNMFPEVVNGAKQIKFHEYRQIALTEMEKFLRRLRVLSLRMDRVSDSLIKKIRKIHVANGIEVPAVRDEKKDLISSGVDNILPIEVRKKSVVSDMLKKEEQELIIEIAQDPKNSKLYEKLGDLYLKMDAIEDAIESYKTALQIEPENIHLSEKHSKTQQIFEKHANLVQ